MAKTEIRITINVGELFYDIATKTYLAAGELQRFINDIVSVNGGDVAFVAKLPYFKGEKETARKQIVQKDLFSCFVNFILCKWFELTDKERCEYYLANYNDFIKGVRRKLCMKHAPTKAEYE